VKTCPNIILFEKNPTYICLGLNPGVRSERMTAEGLSHDAVILLSNKKVGFHNPTLSSLTCVYYTARGRTSEDLNPKAPSLPVRLKEPFQAFYA
jgi:hypothetical protein